MKLLFRKAAFEDAEAIAAIVNSAYRGESSRVGWTTEADLLDGQRTDPESLQRMMSSSNQVFLLAFAADETSAAEHLVGSAHLEKTQDGIFLGMLTVRPTAQAQGLGRQLIREAEEFARREWAAHELFMTVISLRSELISYYARRGYLPTGERKPFPRHDPRFGLPKRSDFDLLVLKKTL